MSLNHYVYIFRSNGIDPAKNRAEIKSDKMFFVAITVDRLEQAIEVAKAEIQKALN